MTPLNLKTWPESGRSTLAAGERTESGGLVVGAPDRPHVTITVAEKGPAWRRLRIHGTSGHGSTPYGATNAAVVAAEVVRRLGMYESDTRVHDLWRRYVEAADLPPSVRCLLLDPDRLNGGLAHAGDEAKYAHACTHTTVTPITLRGRTKINVIPDSVELEVVAGVAEATQTPPDLPGCVGLASLSTAAGGSNAVVQARLGWIEPVNVYTAVAMPPGSRKSAVFREMTAPLLAAELQLTDQARPQIAEAELALRVARARAEKTTRAAENATTEEARTTALAEASDAAAAVDQLTVPVIAWLIADDVTPEAAATLLADQKGRLAVLSAEGGIFGTLAGRYSAGPNLEVFLKGHAGDLLRVDRKGRPAEHVERPALTLGPAVQPEVLRDIARMPGFRGRGLLARILYALPVNTVGRRRIAPPPVPDQVAESYETRLRALVARLHDLSTPAVITLNDAARARLQQFEAELEPQLGADGQLGHITDWASKLAGVTCRLAGLMHLADRLHTGWDAPIAADTLDNATRLARYFLGHALAVFDNVMGADPLVDDARTILDWITRHADTGEFTRRDLYVSVHSTRWSRVADLDPGLAVLEQHGYIARFDTAPGPRGGRPSVRYAIHPSVQPTKPTQPTEGSDEP